MIVPFGSMKKTTVTEFTRYEDEILGKNDELTRLVGALKKEIVDSLQQ